MADVDPRTFVNVHDAKTNFSRLLDRAHSGEDIILAKAGVPYAKLVRYADPCKVRRTPGGLKVTGPINDDIWTESLPKEDLDYIDDRSGAE